MSQPERFEVLILGSGQGGKLLVGIWRDRGDGPPSLSAGGSGAPVPTWSGVWALGESAGSPQFTHVSVDDFRIIRDNLAGGKRSTRDRQVPYCLFTDPQLAHVG